MRVKMYLKRPDSKTETAIYARVSFNGHSVKVFFGESINPKFWNEKDHRAKLRSTFRESSELNSRLDSMEMVIKDTYRASRTGNGQKPISTAQFKAAMDEVLRPKKERTMTFFEFFDHFIEECEVGTRRNGGKRFASGTIKAYRTAYNHLKSFADAGNDVRFENIDMEFYNAYRSYVVNAYNLKENSFGKDVKILKTILNDAAARKLHTNTAYKSKGFKVVDEASEHAIYLTVQEQIALAQLDLSQNKTLDDVRDLFLISCNTGLRYSDSSQLNESNIKADGLIHITQQKTGARVPIPINDVVKGILQKRGGQFPKAISNQKTNQYLKQIGKMVDCLHEPVLLTYEKGGQIITEQCKKFDLLTTHTGRRSFATNEYLKKDISVHLIMKITGHKNEASFFRYIRLSDTDQAKMVQMIWEQRKAMRIA